MATATGSITFTSIGGNNYSYSLTGFAVTWTEGSTNRSVGSYSNPIGTAACGSGSYGVSIAWSETVSGVPQSGTFSFSAQVPACPVSYEPVWVDTTLAAFQASVAYSDAVSASNMEYSGQYVLSGALPSGVSLNSNTGVVSGTPSVAGQSFSFDILAQNAYGGVLASFGGVVAAAPTAGKLKVWNGSAWVYGPVKVWDGSVWVGGTVKVWNGSGWVTSV